MEAELTAPEDPGTALTKALLEEGRVLTPSERHWIARWMGKNHPELVIEATLWAIGDNPQRPGLINTPKRAVKSWSELYAGYGQVARDVFTDGSDKGFDCEQYNQMIILRNISFTSMCEHHILPFTGKAHVAYIPNEYSGLLGVSKLARLVDLNAQRLQNQERITQNTVDDLMEVSGAQGAGVQLVASHSCMVCRGVKKPGAEMVTTALRGVFMDASARSEFITAIRA